MLYAFAFLTFVLGLVIATAPPQPGDQLVKFAIDNDIQQFFLDSLVETEQLDIWSFTLNHARVNSTTLKLFDQHHIRYTPVIEDVYSLVAQQALQNAEKKVEIASQPLLSETWFEAYHSYDEMVTFVKELCSTHSDVVECSIVGTSIQGREIILTKFKSTATKAVYFQGCQHAREWISPATVLYLIYKLATEADSIQVKAILSNFQVSIVPVVNPDGYEFSRTNNRLWRKNRRDNAGSIYYGVDLNRNWNERWCQVGASTRPSSDTYCGTAPFSEPETKAVSDYVLSLSNVVGLIDFHAYGQLWLRPYGATTSPTPDENSLRLLGQACVDAIKAESGLSYQNIRSAQLYPASGSAEDWGYTNAGVYGSFTVELRDEGRYGFLLPPAQIIPSGQEIWSASIAYFEELAARFN